MGILPVNFPQVSIEQYCNQLIVIQEATLRKLFLWGDPLILVTPPPLVMNPRVYY